MAMKKMAGGSKKPVAKKTAVTKSRGSKTAKQMGDMNEREGYNQYARSERSTSATKINAERRAKSGPGGKKNIKPKKVVGYRYGDHPPSGARKDGSHWTGESQGTNTYYNFQNKGVKREPVADKTNRRAGGGKNLSGFESASKASSKGVANKPKGSLKSTKAKPKAMLKKPMAAARADRKGPRKVSATKPMSSRGR